MSAPWNARAIEKSSHEYEAALPSGAWPNWVLGNHDRPRVASRVGRDQARVAAMLLLTLRGTPTMYYGDEIGMRQVAISPDQVRDPFEKNVPDIGVGRDGCRTPMQWDATSKCWLLDSGPVAAVGRTTPSTKTWSISTRIGFDSQSLRALIGCEEALPLLRSGDYVPVAADGRFAALSRGQRERQLVIALNLGGPADLGASSTEVVAGPSCSRLSSTGTTRDIEGAVDLRGNEGVIIDTIAGIYGG